MRQMASNMPPRDHLARRRGPARLGAAGLRGSGHYPRSAATASQGKILLTRRGSGADDIGHGLVRFSSDNHLVRRSVCRLGISNWSVLALTKELADALE
jgi:hypothetical protein